MTFQECCSKYLENKNLVKEYNRLTGSQLGQPKSPIEVAIDKSCNYDPDRVEIEKFVAFVYEFIWQPVANSTQ